MSKILYVCSRNLISESAVSTKIENICQSLNPDNIESRPCLIQQENNTVYGISNPTSTIRTKGLNVLLGKIYGEETNWYRSSTNSPDGNYAIIRSDENIVELVTDVLGTRSIWYYLNDENFIASTSQKAIIQYLGDFQFNEGAIPWILSTGSLGPGYSWDKRIKKVPADGSVTLNRKNWTITERSGKVEFNPSSFSLKDSKKLLKNALLETFRSLNLAVDKWAITLSGGHDSRAVVFLHQKTKEQKYPIKTLTWGAAKTLQDKESDAYVAEKVSNVLETNHNFFSTELPEEPLEVVIERFLHNGEGRIDHIPAYLDGFSLWKRIFEADIEGIIRGDEIFGYNKIYSPLIVKSFMGLTLLSDFSNLKKYDYLNSLKQEMPQVLKKKDNESLSTWRDRIFQLYRIPYIQSALADIKYPYIEQINPFLSRKIVNVIRQMPDSLRSNKRLFKEVMKQWDLGVPFATRASTLKFTDILRKDSFVEVIKKELNSAYARQIFPDDFLNKVVKNMKKQKDNDIKKKKGTLERIKSLIPTKIKTYLAQQNPSLQLDENILAFRIFIICRMHKELSS